LDKSPRWVILAYFEGNDLYDAASYEQASPFILPRFAKYMLARELDTLSDERPASAVVTSASNFRYPINLTIQHHELKIAFFSYYIAWLSVGREAIASSQNYSLVKETILKMQELSAAEKSHFLVVYVPSKEHVYLPYLNNADVVANVFTDVPLLKLDEAGYLQFTNKHATPQLTVERSDDQSHLLADFAAQQNFYYLDLTPVFQKEAGAGVELYYRFDTHWNQLGHNLAADIISKYIHEIPDSSGN
jgi:hypothetical protein